MTLIDKVRRNFVDNKEVFREKGSEFEVNNWVISDFILSKLVPVVGVRPFPLAELSLLSAAVCWSRPTHIFEWGTHIGKSARVFFETCKYFDIKAEIHSIDLPNDVSHVEHPKERRGKLVKGKPNVFLHQGDGLNNSLQILKEIKESKPLFYVDGDHSYDSVYRELSGILKNVGSPRVILHDTFFQSAESNYNIGPYQAIKDIMKEYSDRNLKVIKTNTGLPGMTFLYS